MTGLVGHRGLLLGATGATVPGVLTPFYPTNLYSFRLRNAAYSGPCCRVVRSSDSALFDIGFNPVTGLISATDINTALVGHATDSLRMSIWYDQGGSGDNAVQATTANQPLLVVSGSTQQNALGFTCPKYDANTQRMTIPNSARLDYAADFSIEMLANTTLPSPGGQTRYFDIIYPTSQQGLVYLVGTTAELFIGGTNNVLATAVVSNSVVTNVAWTRSGSSNRVFYTGTQATPTVTNSQNFTGNVLWLGNDFAGSSNSGVLGNIFEVRLTKGSAVQTANYTPWTCT